MNEKKILYKNRFLIISMILLVCVGLFLDDYILIDLSIFIGFLLLSNIIKLQNKWIEQIEQKKGLIKDGETKE